MRFRICIAVVFCTLFLIRASAQQPRPSSPEKEQKPAGRSIIRGRVINADTGRPVRRAEVTLRVRDSRLESAFNHRQKRRIHFLQRGSGQVFRCGKRTRHREAFQQLRRNDSLEAKLALGQIEDAYSEVTVDGRSSVKTEIRASRGGVITGRVMTESDEPIAKAQIKLFQIENGRVRPSTVTEYTRDRDKWMFEKQTRADRSSSDVLFDDLGLSGSA